MHLDSHLRIKRKLQRVLINAGAEGITQTDLLNKTRTRIWSRDRIKEILKDWKARDLVQTFEIKVKTSKRPVKIWRATTLIRTERL